MKYVISFFVLLLTGCAIPEPPPDVDTTHLLNGALLGYESAKLDETDILAITAEMQQWVDQKTGQSNHARVRLKSLVQGLIDDGLLSLEYDDNLTRTPIETFNSRRGNCLSFSMLFVTLAREAGLDVTFQMVDIPPSFSSSGEIVKLNNHINVLVRRVRSDTQFHQDHVVDFNSAEYNGNYDTRRVSDNYALALYHSNLGVEHLQAGELKNAFLRFRRGIELDPDNPGIWTNLGALYSMQGFPDAAMLAYQKALTENPSYRSALVNLAKVLRDVGRTEEADSYSARARHYQNRNPYYHYHQAKQHYRTGDATQTLDALSRAIKLKDDEHLFYQLQGFVYERTGATDKAIQSYEQAKKVTEQSGRDTQYARKLKLLSS